MNDTLAKWIMMCVSVAIFSTLVAAILWTVVLGSNIISSLQDEAVTYYSEAGLSVMIESSNLDSVDATNLYKMLEINRNSVSDYSIKNLDGSYVRELKELLSRPIDRFSVVIQGDSAVGFEVTAEQVVTPKVGDGT